MSKSDNNQRSAHTGQLKKDVGQTIQILHNLTNSLAKIESSLVESDGIRATERRCNEKISKVQQEITDLQDQCREIENQRQQEANSFATATLQLSHNFEERLIKKDQERKSEVDSIQTGEASQQQTLKRSLDSAKAEVVRLKENEITITNQVETKLKELKESCRKSEDSLKSNLKALEEHVLQLSVKNRDLAQELDEHQVIMRGKEMEISKLVNKLAALEAFSSAPPNQVQSVITGLQSSLQDFCVSCVESDGILPGWHPIPKGLQHQGLPRHYSTESAAGRYVLTAAIQHSVWVAMAENVFESYGLQDSQSILGMANALYRKDRSKEAVWRVLTATTILDDPGLLEILRNQLDNIAHRLVVSWQLFQEEQQRDEFRTRLSALLYGHSTEWLSLLKLRKRISMSLQWDGRHFETDTGEGTVQIPGDFVQHGDVTPILFLSPAFLEDNIDSMSGLPSLIQKGKALLKTSPLLLTALKEEQQISSPRLANKSPNSRTGKESLS